MKKLKSWLAVAGLWLLGFILVCPCLLTFTEGMDGSPTVWNFVGLAWIVMLVFSVKFLFHDK